MTTTIHTLLLLIAVLVVVAIVARRFNTAPSIPLVIAGIALALIPGLPRIELAPDLVLLGILPPLIYSAGVAMSWREFRFNLRPITLLAVGLAIPLMTLTGAPFPYRDLILFVTFGVIVVTLVGQGLLLPTVVRWLGLGMHAAEEREREHAAELAARAEALNLCKTGLTN